MSYDHWKTTNPADEFLGPDPEDYDEDGLAEFELSCEQGWLRAAESDPEAYDEMVRDDMAGKS
jgi:hypothetical protein